MGKILIVCRLAARDLRHRQVQAILLLLAVTAATTVLTLGLALHGVTSQPYQQTRAATNGPDVVAYLPVLHQPGKTPGPPAEAAALARASGVTGHSGPYPIVGAIVRFRGLLAGVDAEGRTQAAAAVDQPKLTAGSWVRPGGVVLERTFAEALGTRIGDRVTLNGRGFTIAGIAVTAANAPYPNLCYSSSGGCHGNFPPGGQQITFRDTGLAWVTEADAISLTTPASPLSTYVENLRLADPAAAQAFTLEHASNPGIGAMASWQGIATADGLLVADEQAVLNPGAALATLLAIAMVAVLAGARMAERTRRTGLLKAAGGTPGLVAAVLLAENLVISLAAAVIGLVAGRLAAPLITSPGAALVGAPGAPSLTVAVAGEVVAAAAVVALGATLVPALRAARASTVSALAASARPPRRGAGLIAVSRLLPVPLLLGLRLVARRPRRALLGMAAVAVTATGIVAVLTFNATAGRLGVPSANGLSNPEYDRDEQMLMVLTVMLVALAVLNAVCAAWATALDARTASALSRALGATPRQVTIGIAAAHALPALPGAVIGVPLGIGLFVAASGGGMMIIPSAWWLAAAVLATTAAVAVLASIPARAGARRPAGEVLAAETT